MKKTTLISQQSADARFARALKLRIGLGKLHSFASVAEAAQMPERTLRSYADEENTPPLHAILSLFSVLGPGFASDVLGLASLDATPTEHDEPQHRRALTDLTRFAADLSEALEDGHVDHKERAALRGPAQAVIDLMMPIAAMSEPVTVPLRSGGIS